MESLFAKVKFFRFWPKTMDYNKAFWPKSRSFFVVLLLQNGRCYGAEICTIPLLLRCSFRWNPFLSKSKFSDFGQKPWTIMRHFGRNQCRRLRLTLPLPDARSSPNFTSFCWTVIEKLCQNFCAHSSHVHMTTFTIRRCPPVTPHWKELQSSNLDHSAPL